MLNLAHPENRAFGRNLPTVHLALRLQPAEVSRLVLPYERKFLGELVIAIIRGPGTFLGGELEKIRVREDESGKASQGRARTRTKNAAAS